MKRLEDTRIAFRLYLSTLTAGLALLALGAYALHNLHATMLEDRQIKTRHLVEGAHSLLAHYQAREADGSLAPDAARQAALAAVKALRYGDNDYFWIQDRRLKMVMHPIKPELDGSDLSGVRDPEGLKLFVEMDKVVADRGAGFVAYMWPKPGHTSPQPKLSYVTGFQPWGWIIGSGIYVDDVEDAFRAAALSLVIILGVAIAALLALSATLARGILRQLGGEPAYVREVAARIADGDLVQPVAQAPAGSVVHAMAVMQAGLGDLLRHVHGTAEELARHARAITESARAVDASANAQVNATTAMAAEVEELAASITEVADMARQTEDNSTEVARQAGEGDPLARQTNHCIQAIADTVASSAEQIVALRHRSQEIGRIAQVIDEIAVQTNLLALNAAIEAARAGEMGRGFSVVADEVRQLAERTSEATQEISTMIAGIQGDTEKVVAAMARAEPQVAEGSGYAGRLADSLGQINARATDSLGKARDVAHASKEQAMAVNDISGHVENIADMADQTHNAVQSNAEQAVRLDRLAGELQTVLARFRID